MKVKLFLLLCSILSLLAEPNGSPNISMKLNSNAHNFDLFADFLLWTARESGTDCWAEVFSSSGSTTTDTLEPVHFEWDPGFRVGMGYGTDYDSWHTQAYFTWFHTKGKDAIYSDPGTVHSSFIGAFYLENPTGAGISGPPYQNAHISWAIDFNIFDWELGRNFWVSRALILRPFIGIKGGWIDQSIRSIWENPTILLIFELINTSSENLKNNFWGIGPITGLNSKWNLYHKNCNSLNLFGNFSFAMMYAHWSFKDVFQNEALAQRIKIDLQDINGGATMLRTLMGFEWNRYFRKHRFSLKLGYEVQVWYDQLQYYSFIGGRLNNELTLQGGTLECSIDY